VRSGNEECDGGDLGVALCSDFGLGGSLSCRFDCRLDTSSCTGTFATHEELPTGNGPTSVVAADFNGDGVPDFAITHRNFNNVSVLLNTTLPGSATSSFTAGADFALGANTAPEAVAAGDINGDGRLDLAVAEFGTGAVGILLNATPPGSFTPVFNVANISTGGSPSAVTFADITGDGRPDVVVGTADRVRVLVNNTTLGANVASLPDGFNVGQATGLVSVGGVAAGDLNGDGRPDIAVADIGGPLGIFLNTTPPGAPIPTLDGPVAFAAGSGPRAIAMGDFDNDGKLDLAAGNQSSNDVSVLFNQTAPGSTSPTFNVSVVTSPTEVNPGSLTVVDVDGDGRLDIAAANASSNSISILVNTVGPGAIIGSPFGGQIVVATGDAPLGIASADVNGDGRVDLITANQFGDDASVLLNATARTAGGRAFVRPPEFRPGPGRALALGDINNDGRLDLVTADTAVNTMRVLQNDTTPGSGVASFTGGVDFGTGVDPFGLAVADLDGDGLVDVDAAGNASTTISVLRNTSAPGFTASFDTRTDSSTGVSSAPFAVAIGDLNGDGRPEVVSANQGVSKVSVFVNKTIGGGDPLEARKDFATGTSPRAVAIGDLNGDGQPDLVTANAISNDVSILLNATPFLEQPQFAPKRDVAAGVAPFSVALDDFNGDGKLDIAAANNDNAGGTLAILLNETPTGSTAVAFAPVELFAAAQNCVGIVINDLNGDGRPDVVVSNFASDNVTVFFNSTIPGAPVPAFLPLPLEASVNPRNLVSGDLNGDGRQDLAVFNEASGEASVLLATGR
jgi:hypothetical protein